MATKQLIFSTIFSLILLPSIALAQPAIPHQFYGYVNFLNGPAPDGLLIEAKIDGITVANTTTLNGRYGYNPKLFFVTDPESNRAGKTISFFVNGVDTGKTAIFVNGEHTKLDFLINGTVGTQTLPSGSVVENQTTFISPTSPVVYNIGNEINITLSSSTSTTATIEKIQKLTSDFVSTNYGILSGTNLLNAFEIKITGNVSITVTISYDDTGINESTVMPYKFNGTAWVLITPYTRNEVANTLTFEIQAETPYVIFGFPPTPAITPPTPTIVPPVVVPTLPTRALSIIISGNATMTAGTTNTLTITVFNIGNATETGVRISFTGIPTDWIAITPASTNIAVATSQDYLATIAIPSNETGTRTVIFTATSAEGTTASRSITLTIVAPTVAPPAPVAVCGNGICEPGETPENCPADCAVVSPTPSPFAAITGMIVSVVTNPIYASIIAIVTIATIGIALRKKKVI